MNATPSNTKIKDNGNASCSLQANVPTCAEPFTSDLESCALEEKINVGNCTTNSVAGNDRPERTDNLVIAHQFRTPMAIIQANSELLTMLAGTSDNEVKDKMTLATERIKTEIARMTDLMNEILLLGKISAGKLDPKKEFSDITEVCKDLATKYNSIQKDDRKVAYSIIGEPRDLFMNSNLMSNAISNLLSNAIKYSNKGNPELELVFESEQVRIHVSDTGIGIPEEELQYLFSPFHRAANVGSIPGTGLGLSIVMDYVELHGGSVSVESVPNKKTTFSITLPTGKRA